MSRTHTAASSSSTRQWTCGNGPAASTDSRSGAKRQEFEVNARVSRIEQQMQEKLPREWQEFAGKPMQIQYYDTMINTYRENPNLLPSEAYMQRAVKELQANLEREKLSVFNDDELRDIVLQEWRTDMTRCVWQTRLNRHDSKDGPVVRRSRSGVITVTSQPTPGEKFIVDAFAQTKKTKTK